MDEEEFTKEYVGLTVEFVAYYKHRFTYKGKRDGKEITVVLGDPDGDIYGDTWWRMETIERDSHQWILDFTVKEIEEKP